MRVAGVAAVVGLIGVTAIGVLIWAHQPEENRAMDQHAQALADAVSYPRQASAEDYGGAVAARGIDVLSTTDLTATGTQSPTAELVIHLHAEPTSSGNDFRLWTPSPVDACYRLTFNPWQGTSTRIDCPGSLQPLVLSPPDPAVVHSLNPTCRSGSDDCPGG